MLLARTGVGVGDCVDQRIGVGAQSLARRRQRAASGRGSDQSNPQMLLLSTQQTVELRRRLAARFSRGLHAAVPGNGGKRL